VRLPLREQDRIEIRRFALRSACRDCFFFVEKTQRCAHEWPVLEQNRWPLDGVDGSEPADEISLCKEFELR
jgi:hypothetical protein